MRLVRTIAVTLRGVFWAGLVAIVCSAPLACAPTGAPDSSLGPGLWTGTVEPASGETTWQESDDSESAGDESGTDDVVVAGEEVTASDAEAKLYVTPTELNLGSVAESGYLFVRNVGEGSLSYDVTSDVAWATLEGARGTSEGLYKSVLVNVDRSGLGLGNHEATLTVVSGAEQASVSLRMTVGDGGGPTEPLLLVDKQDLDFEWGLKQATFTVQNAGGGELNYTIDSDVAWATPATSEGTSSGEQDVIQVHVTREDLTPGEYVGLISVTTDDGQWHGIALHVEVLLSAADWGFDPEDATAAIQSAILSGATKIMIPNMGQPWISRPIRLVSNQEVYLEPGTVVLAKEGEFQGTTDCLFRAEGVENLLIWGYGATLRMRKDDYIGGEYEPSEYRHCLYIRGGENIRVCGLKLEDSGGVGICIGPWWNPTRYPPRNVEIRECTCDGNYREGIFVSTAENLTISDCVMRNTAGHNTQAGMDIEPDCADDVLANIVIEGCVSEYNAGCAYAVWLDKLTSSAPEVSIDFTDCYARECDLIGYLVQTGANGARGGIEFRNCRAERTDAYGFEVTSPTRAMPSVRFLDCTWSNVSTAQWRRPLMLELPLVSGLNPIGRVELVDCVLEDGFDRPCLNLNLTGGTGDVVNVAGNLDVYNPFGSSGWTPPPELAGLSIEFRN